MVGFCRLLIRSGMFTFKQNIGSFITLTLNLLL